MNHLLLAYDGSPKGREALFVSAYLGSKYNRKLTVLVVEKDAEKGEKLIKEAGDYLGDSCHNTVFKQNSGRVAREILRTVDEENADLIVMGGYGLSPILEALFGSTVDSVLRGTRVPVIVCQ